jgi:hypothetical protein
MARTNRLAALQKAIASLGEDKHERRYDERLTKEIVAHARSRQVSGVAQKIIAEELGVSQATLSRMMRRESKLIPVKVVADSKARSSSSSKAFLVRGPGGVVVEGLSLEEVAVLFARIASCSG